jgi:hypothetical protein
VARLCQSCLDPNPTRRPSAEVVVDRLRAFVTSPCHPVAPRADLHRTVPRTVPAPATAGHAAPPAVWGRRAVVTVGAAVAVVTVGALLLVLNQDNGGGDGQYQAVLPPAQTTTAPATSAAPTTATTSPTPRPHRTTPPPPRTSAPVTSAPSPTPVLTLAAAAAQFNKLVDTGEANGAIRKDVADDLQQVLFNATHASTPSGVHDGLVQLRGKIEQRTGEQGSPPAITVNFAQELVDSVDRMLAITPTAA